MRVKEVCTGAASVATFGLIEIAAQGSMAYVGPALIVAGTAGCLAWRYSPGTRQAVAVATGHRGLRIPFLSRIDWRAMISGQPPTTERDDDIVEDEKELEQPEPQKELEQHRQEVRMNEDEGEDEEGDEQIFYVLPQAPSFRDMAHLIQPGRLVLCYSNDGPVYGTVQDLLSMCIVGKPGRGKTTALIYYVAMLLKDGAEVHVWDPHGSMSELSGMSDSLTYTDDFSDVPDSIEYLLAELEERRQLYKATKKVKRPLLFLVDELPVIAQYGKKNKDVAALFEKFVLEARKWNCFFIGAGQSTDAEILPTRVTENMSSRVVFYCSNRRAGMAGVDSETSRKFLPLIKPDDVKGCMIFDCSRFDPFIGAIPWVTVEDVKEWLGVSADGNANRPTGNRLETPPQAEPGRVITDVFPVSHSDGNAPETGLQDDFGVSPETLECIRRMKDTRYPDREIASLVGLSGRKYKLYQQALIHLGYVAQAQ